jgi:transposase InsO family protein
MIPPSRLFVVWGLDNLGSFPRAVRGFRYLYITIDKFTRWLAMVKINKQSTVKFIKSIICKFEVPNRIITDNGSQFTNSAFHGYCVDLGVKLCYVFIAHPKSNG